MKYIKLLKKSLMKNYNKSLKFKIILNVFIAGTASIFISAGLIKLFYNRSDVFTSITAGFIISYFLFTDTSLYLFKNIKKLNPVKFNLTVIRDLLIIMFFFIISNKFINFNFVLIAVGITITPVSVSLLRILFPHIVNYASEE